MMLSVGHVATGGRLPFRVCPASQWQPAITLGMQQLFAGLH